MSEIQIADDLKKLWADAQVDLGKPWHWMQIQPRTIIDLIERVSRAEAENASLRAQVEALKSDAEVVDTCESCDAVIPGAEGHYTEDDALLCEKCWDGMAAALECHSDECSCALCLAAQQAQKEPTNG